MNLTQQEQPLRSEFLHCLQKIVNFSHATLQTIAARTNHVHVHEHEHQHEHEHEHEYTHDLNQEGYFDITKTGTTTSHTDSYHDHDNDGLLLAKMTAMFVLFFASSFCGSLPFLVQYYFNWPNKKHHENIDAQSTIVVKCLLYFGGGVLLCTTFMHLLPEVQESIENLKQCNLLPALKFPLAELFMCSGFFLMYLVEETIHTFIHYQQTTNSPLSETNFDRGHSIRRSVLLMKHNGNTLNTDACLNTTTTTTTETTNSSIVDVGAIKTVSTRDLITNDEAETTNHLHQHHHHHHQAHSHGYEFPTSTGKNEFNASLRGLFIVLALSIHELFEGMAIGLEHSTSAVWVMFGAVSAHKLVLAFCVGVELIVARTRPLLSIIYILTFAIVSPVGIGIGILISNQQSDGSSVTAVILQGLACGTLLYVVFFEILSRNYAGLKAVAAMICGFAIMFGLQLLGEASHSHSHGGCGLKTPITSRSHTIDEQIEMLRHASNSLLQQQKTQQNQQ